MTRTVFTTAVITADISDKELRKLEGIFAKVYNLGDGLNPELIIPDHVLREADIWYTNWVGIPPSVTSLEQIPRTKAVQLSSAGANKFMSSQLMASGEAKKRITVCSASGIHVVSIPPYIVANVINVYMSIPLQILVARQEARWAAHEMPHHRSVMGKTVGLLGYGHIARETARLFKALNCEIIAANSSGRRTEDTGYVVPGTGDISGSIPSKMYSTSDEGSFDEFLSRSDILVASLPSTLQTEWLMSKERLARLPPRAVFVNVGRGDLIKSDDLIDALNREGGLSNAVLDVTDPEPLPKGHPLFTHPKVILTPHTSAFVEDYFDLGAELLIKQAEQYKQGKPLLNIVDPVKGY